MIKLDKGLFLSFPIVGDAQNPCTCLKGNFVRASDLIPRKEFPVSPHGIRNEVYCFYWEYLGHAAPIFLKEIAPRNNSFVNKYPKTWGLLNKYEKEIILPLRAGQKVDKEQIKRDFLREVLKTGEIVC
jgi:hypothetical protein